MLARRFASAVAVASTLVGGPAIAADHLSPAAAPASVHVSFHRIVSGLSAPVQVVAAADGTSRLFVVEQGGVVRVVSHGKLLARPYLDISSEVVSGGEQGLLSIAFHPNFSKHRYVYVAYTRSSDGSLQVSRFTASSAAAGSVKAATESNILLVPHTQAANHNGGQLVFGRAGYLYVTTGDGGSEGDPFGHAENLDSLSGKILRIDVNHACGSRHYCIPKSNPFAGSSSKKPAIFDWGLRNPWRMSVDRANGTLWIGEVGQDAWEEIDHTTATGDRDFGWSCKEGRSSYNSNNCTIGGKQRHITGPLHVYHHTNGRCAVIGGLDYDGPAYSFAHGLYVYGDYCTGEVWALGKTNGTWANAKVGDVGSDLTGFGQGDAGEIYAVDQAGSLYHLVFHRA
jgi:hypothetical protein